MAPNTSLNGDNCTKIFRVIQFIVCLITLALVGENISAYHNIRCNAPPRLSYNAACAGITFPVLLYLLLSTGSHKLNFLPWNQWFQLFIDGFFFILWLAAASVSKITCDMMCSACKGPMWAYVQVGDTSCTCTYTVELDKRASSSTSSSARLGKSIGTLVAKQGVDAVMVLLFFATLVATINGIYTQRKALKGHGPATAVPSTRTTDINTAYEPMQYQAFGEQQKYKQNAHVEETAVDANNNAYPSAGYSNPAGPYGFAPQQPASAYTGGNTGGGHYTPLMGQAQSDAPYSAPYHQGPYAGT